MAGWTGAVAVLAMLCTLGCGGARIPGGDLPTAARQTIEFEDVAFEVAGRGWEQGSLSRGVMLVRSYGDYRSEGIALWVVDVPPALRDLSRGQHAARYFAEERTVRHQPYHWNGFTEGMREVAGAPYAVMTVRFTGPEGGHRGDGLFLLYFPADFELRQRFYVLLWSDIRPAGSPGRELGVFDGVVASLRVRPFQQYVGTGGSRAAPS